MTGTNRKRSSLSMAMFVIIGSFFVGSTRYLHYILHEGIDGSWLIVNIVLSIGWYFSSIF